MGILRVFVFEHLSFGFDTVLINKGEGMSKASH